MAPVPHAGTYSGGDQIYGELPDTPGSSRGFFRI